ncbi:MAG: transglycosylase domain-containing protein, partial [Litorivicinaceae bacterium]
MSVSLTQSSRYTVRMKAVIRFLLKVSLVALVGLGMVLVYLNAQLTKQFEALSFSVGATVYARPLELYVGQTVSQSALLVELDALGYRRVTGTPARGQYRVIDRNRVQLTSRGHRFADGEEPARGLSLTLSQTQLTALTDLSGVPVSVARLDPVVLAQLSGSHADRELVRLAEVPSTLVALLIAVEDRQFWEHHGISVTGIARAAWVNLSAGRFAQGGSTITQQLIKNLYLTRERTLSRKLIEVIYALLLEAQVEKEAILEAYLNEVFLGQWGARAIHGFGTASRFYFGKPLAELELSEQAMLVALIKGPTAFNPRQSPERARTRRNLVLTEAAEAGVISQADARAAQQRPLNVPARPADRVGRFPAYVERVQRELQDDYSREDLISDGLRIYTAMDPVRQAAAQAGLRETLDALGQQGLDAHEALQGAVVLLDIPTGELQAILGGRRADGGFNRALDARRQIGSLVKPFVVASALTRQPTFHSGTFVRDDPITLTLPNGTQW